MTDRYYYIAELVDSISISASHNSDYCQNCLDYIPGSAVSGALACRLYRNGKADEKILDRIFQNNEAVFSNCLPLEDMHPVFPAPSCLHYEKGTNEDNADYINLVKSQPGTRQLKQVRTGYLNCSGHKYSVVRHSSTKTSIDYRTQTAAESKLFTLNFIDSGAKFWGYIDIPDNTLSRECMEEFLNSQVRIGKCRSSEFGRVKLGLISEKESEMIENFMKKLSSAANDSGELYLWCLSDVEFIDLKTVQGTFEPQGSNLWVGGSSFSYYPEKSFIRTERVRYFNRKRNGYDSEKCLIKRGSIICFKSSSQLKQEQLDKIAREGIGFSRHLGMGRVIVNPSWMNQENLNNRLFDAFCFDKVDEGKNDRQNYESEYNYLFDYLDSCHRQSEAKKQTDSKAGELLEQIVGLYKKARKFNQMMDSDQYGNSIDSSVQLGPNNTQWGVLRACLSEGRDCMDSIRNKLKDERQRDSSRFTWDLHFASDSKTNTTFADEFLILIGKADRSTLVRLFDVLGRYDLSRLDIILNDAKEMMENFK